MPGLGALRRPAVLVCVSAAGLYSLRRYTRGGVCRSDAQLTGKVVIITGANTGLGKMHALDHVRRGARVIMACRSVERGEAAAADILDLTGAPRSQVKVMKLDLASLDSIRSFVQEFKHKEGRLDVLTNNAGVMWVPHGRTQDGFETTMGINHLGPFYLTHLLLGVLQESAPSRVVTVSSRAYSRARLDLDDLMSDTSYSAPTAYCNSKLANVLFTRELAKRLKGTGVTAYCLHPGVVSTDLYRHQAWVRAITPLWDTLRYFLFKDGMEGAQTQIYCSVHPGLAKESGRYYSDCKEKKLLDFAKDDITAAKLWKISAELVGLEEGKTQGDGDKKG